MRVTPYTPARAAPQSIETLRAFVQQELDKIALAMQLDQDEIGDSRHTDSASTGLLLWVSRAGTPVLSRVTVGATDSGGAGYRLLRVVN